MGNAPIGVGVVGLGAIGRVHTANLLAGVRGARLARVADTSAQARRWLHHLCEVPSSGSYLDVLEDSSVDAVVIATPPAAHPEMVELAAAEGKQVFCEKPLGLDIAAAEKALSAAIRAGVALQVGFHRRFDPDFMLAKTRIEWGELGSIYSFFDSMRDMEPSEAGPSRDSEQTLLHDAACHDLDAARWLVGEIDEVRTFGATLASDELRQAGQIDHAITVLRFENGSLGVIDNSLASGYGFDCRCEIVGSKATVRVDNPYVSNVEWLTGQTSGFQRTRNFLERFERSYPTELEAFVAAVRVGSDVPVRGEDGLAAVVLATAAQRSLEANASIRLRHTSKGHHPSYAIDTDQPAG
jgi:myo-inositol 2-dehydrogenase / D-chiro-inositol 1-dehydrogenase